MCFLRLQMEKARYYHAKLVTIKKDMILLHEKSAKLKVTKKKEAISVFLRASTPKFSRTEVHPEGKIDCAEKNGNLFTNLSRIACSSCVSRALSRLLF